MKRLRTNCGLPSGLPDASRGLGVSVQLPPIRRATAMSRIAFALAAGLSLGSPAASGFDVDRADVREAYLGEATTAKRQVALDGLNELLAVQGTLPGGGGGAAAVSFTSGLGGRLVVDPPPVTISTTLDAAADGELGTIGDPLILDGTLLNVLSDFSSARDVTVAGGGGIIDTHEHTLTLSGTITNTGPLIKRGEGTLRLTGANVWTPLSIGSAAQAPVFVLDGTLSGTTASLATDIDTYAATRPFIATTVIEFDQDFDGTYAHTINGALDGDLSTRTTLRKLGTGTVTFNARNLLPDGAVEITAGALALAGDGAFAGAALTVASGAAFDISGVSATAGDVKVTNLAGGGEVRLGARTLAVDLAADTAWDGTISGSGGLRLAGDDIDEALTMTASQTYTAATRISKATLKLVAGGALAPESRVVLQGGVFDLSGADSAREIASFAGSGAIRLGANALTTGGDNRATTFSGALSGSGTLTKQGSGTLELLGATQHTGVTRILGGRIATHPGGISDTVINDAELEFRQDDDSELPLTAYSGTISGSGRLIKSGDGVVWLRGRNRYSGGTSVASGVLMGNTDSLTGDIDNAAAVAFYQVADGTYRGQLAGNGSVLFFGPGRLELAGDNRGHTGDTLFSGTLRASHARQLGAPGTNLAFVGGELQLGGDIAADQNVFIAAAGGTIDTGPHTFDLHGGLAGTGVLRKSGAGTFRLSGRHDDFLGRLELTRGRAVLNGAIRGSLRIEPGVVIDVAATPAGIDHLVLNGADAAAVIAGGDVAVAATGTFDRRTEYALITADGGVSGGFDRVSVDQADLSAALSYRPDAVALTIFRTDVPLVTHATSAPQAAVARVLDGFLSTDGNAQSARLYTAINALADDDITVALESIAGTSHAGTIRALGQGQRAANQLITQRLDAVAGGFASLRGGGAGLLAGSALGLGVAPGPARHGAWLRGFGGAGNVDVGGGFDDQSLQFGGLAAGYDVRLNAGMSIGLVGIFSESTLDQGRPFAEVRTDAWSLGGYGRWRDGPWSLDAIASYARQQFKSIRTLALGAGAGDVSASYDGDTWNIRTQAGYAIGQRVTWEPFVAMQYARFATDAYAERGGPLALVVDDSTDNSVRSQLGLRVTTPIRTTAALDLAVSAFAAWSHEFTDDGTLAATIAGDPLVTTLNIAGTAAADDAATFGAAVQYRAGPRSQLFAGFNGEIDADQSVYSANAGLRISW